MKTEIRSQRSEVRSRLLLILFLLLLLQIPLGAQSIILTTGQRIDALGVRREGDMVLAKVQVGSGSGEVGYHLAQIAKIEFPEPRGLKESSDLLSQGQADKALAEINQVVSFYDAFKDVPGSWWSQAAMIKVAALGALQRDTQAEMLATQIEKTVTDPETARAARLPLVSSLIRRQDFDKVEKICDSAIKESTRPEVIAEAWIKKGDLFFAQRKWDDALLAYLRVPVFYRDEISFVPAALLGSARSYVRLDQNERARKSLNELIQMFPRSTEATVAQTEIQKMGK